MLRFFIFVDMNASSVTPHRDIQKSIKTIPGKGSRKIMIKTGEKKCEISEENEGIIKAF